MVGNLLYSTVYDEQSDYCMYVHILQWAKSEVKDGNSVEMKVLWKHTFANDDQH